MALAYQTGTVANFNALYDAFITWVSGISGWSVVETVTTRDKILKSSGSDGKVNMVYRVSGSAEAGNPFIHPADPHKIFPYMFVQGYGAWTPGSPGTGFKPYGQVGPWLAGNVVASGTVGVDSFRIHRYNGTLPLAVAMDSAYLGRTRRVKTADSFENNSIMFDGRRKIYGASVPTPTQLSWSDLSHGEANISSGGIPPLALTSTGSCLVHDAATDKDFVYVFNSSATLVQQWLKYDVETNTWSTLAAPLWTASTTTASALVWDGADTIYAHHGNTTTEFAKYSISGNTWTTLTASPQARPTSFAPPNTGTMTNMVYVPNSITGLGQDVIYIILLASGTVIYRYDVTSNAWRSTSGTGALTAQQTLAVAPILVRSGKFLYFSMTNVTPGTWYRTDLTAGANIDTGWVNVGTVQSALRAYVGLVAINHIPAKVRGHASFNTTYWFLGDADSITVVTKVAASSNHYYWMTFGRFNGSNRTDIMTLSGGVSAGGQVSIPVDDTSKYAQGEPILFWDPATGTTEMTTIFSIVDSTHFKANIVNNYGSGSRAGIDPTQWMAGGNGFALCPTDPLGNNSDNEPAQYVMESLPDANATARSSPGKRGLYQPVPISLFNADTTTAKNETRGFIRNTFSASSGGFPSIQPEEAIKIAGKTYIFFPDTETSRYTVDTRGILIGPID